MSSISLQWIGQEQFVGTDSGNHSVVISTGQDQVGAKPIDLVLIALASCIAVTVIMMFNKQKENITKLEIEAQGERKTDPPRAFTHIHLNFKVSAKEITESGLERAIWVAEQKYCPVAAAVRDTAKITTSFELMMA